MGRCVESVVFNSWRTVSIYVLNGNLPPAPPSCSPARWQPPDRAAPGGFVADRDRAGVACHLVRVVCLWTHHQASRSPDQAVRRLAEQNGRHAPRPPARRLRQRAGRRAAMRMRVKPLLTASALRWPLEVAPLSASALRQRRIRCWRADSVEGLAPRQPDNGTASSRRESRSLGWTAPTPSGRDADRKQDTAEALAAAARV